LTNLANIPEFIRADALRLRQILYNLLSNAVKFTPECGTIGLTAQVITAKPSGVSGGSGDLRREVEIRVVDTGIGLREDDMDRIFEPFSQVESTLSRKYQGTGLGLTLTRRLVQMHDGRIWAESESEGQGAAFCFTLPV